MTQDVRQWLAEIKTLQQKLVEARQERDEAYTGASNWRKLYETEAQQRRTEANLARRTVEALHIELQELQRSPQPSTDGTPDQLTLLKQHLEHLEPSELKQKLVEVLLERDRLTQELKAEQEKHAQTRKGLTTALGDTVDLLTKERAARNGSSKPVSVGATNSLPGASLDSSKTP